MDAVYQQLKYGSDHHYKPACLHAPDARWRKSRPTPRQLRGACGREECHPETAGAPLATGVDAASGPGAPLAALVRSVAEDCPAMGSAYCGGCGRPAMGSAYCGGGGRPAMGSANCGGCGSPPMGSANCGGCGSPPMGSANSGGCGSPAMGLAYCATCGPPESEGPLVTSTCTSCSCRLEGAPAPPHAEPFINAAPKLDTGTISVSP